MIVYLIPFFLYALSQFDTRNRGIFIFLISLSLFLILALRDNIGYDYINYTDIYYSYSLEKTQLIPKYILNFSFLFKDHHYFFFIYSFSTIYFIYKSAIKNNNIYFLVLFIALPGFFIESFTLLKQSLALSLVIYGYVMKENKNKNYYFPLIFACLTHLSALPFVLFFLAYSIFVSLRKTIVLTIIILLQFTVLALEYLSEYLPNINFYSGDESYGYKMLLFYLLFFLFFSKKLYKTNCDSFVIILLGIIFFFYVNQIYYVYNRIVYYFFIPFLFLDYKELLKINKKFLFTLILFILFIVSLNFKTYTSGDDGSMIPYKTILKDIF